MDSRPMEWVVLEMELPAEHEEIAGEVLEEMGAAAQDIRPLDAASLRLIGYFPAVAPPAALAALAESLLRSRLPGLRSGVQAHTLDKVDWVALSRDAFKPTSVGGHFLIHPSWDIPPDPGGRILLEIDPQQAFGTGSHETTRLCIALMEKHFEIDFHRCLDAGCGSGILLIALDQWIRRNWPAEAGRYRLLGVDVDAASVETARENAARNGAAPEVEFRHQDLAAVDIPPYDFIFANLLSEILCQSRALLECLTAPGGRLLLSGILAVEEPEIRRHFREDRWRYRETALDGEWLALALERRGD
jgi:ribosomal protein L11 methyltransferase